MSTFSFHARYVLLTYAQCAELDPFRVMDRIGQLQGECIIGRELHEDGGAHLHVFVDFGRKFRSRKPDVFDVDGRHPNITKSKGNPAQGFDYAIKDGDIVCGGLGRPNEESGGNSGRRAHIEWTEITSAETREEFFELVHRLDPKAAVVSFPALQKYADWRYTPQPEAYESPNGVSFAGGEIDGRDQWLQQSAIGTGQLPVGECAKAPGGAPPAWPPADLRTLPLAKPPLSACVYHVLS